MRRQLVVFVDCLCLKEPMAFLDGVETRIPTHESKERMVMMEFYAMGARDLSTVEAISLEYFLDI